MPRPPSPDARARLLDAAEALFARGEDPSMQAVAAAAGLSRSTLFRRFPSREALLAALVAERGFTPPAGARERALDALAEALLERGLDGLGVDEVAARAGVSAATLYRHFGDREGLVRAFIEERTPRGALGRLDLGKDPEGALVALVAFSLRAMHRNRALMLLLLSPDAPAREALLALRQRQRGSRAMLAEALAQAMARGQLAPGDPMDLAIALLSQVFTRAILLPALEGLPLHDPDDAARRVVRDFLRGALPRSPS